MSHNKSKVSFLNWLRGKGVNLDSLDESYGNHLLNSAIEFEVVEYKVALKAHRRALKKLYKEIVMHKKALEIIDTVSFL